ncbi:MAG: M28 family peptidase [Candidatus Thorarchaeota archaeon]
MNKTGFPAVIFLFVLLSVIPTAPTRIHFATEMENSFVTSSFVNATDIAEEIFNAVSESNYIYFIKKITENGSRVAGSAESVLARDYLVSELENVSEGIIEIEIYGEYDNILGKLPGLAGDTGPCVMIGAHYDSVLGAPGANDDGSGIASTLELARILSNYSWPIDIYFCFWNYEEDGIRGSRETAPMFVSEERDILIYYNIDMLLVPDPNSPEDYKMQMRYLNGTGGIFHDAQYWAEMTQVMSNNFAFPFIRSLPFNSDWASSDQIAFDEMKYKSLIWVFENGFEDDTAYHSSTDVWDNPQYNYTLGAMTTASIGASIAFSLSRTTGQKTHSVFDVDLNSGESQSLLIEVSMLSELDIKCSWDNADGLSFSLTDNSSAVLGINSTDISAVTYSSVLLETPTDFGIHNLTISNTGTTSATLEVTIIQDVDVEGNGVPDSEDTWYNSFVIDSDSDGFFDMEEEFFGLDRFNGDQNNNSIPDLNDDFDGDGVSNVDEIRIYGTSPLLEDTDGDQAPDGWEIDVGLDPLGWDYINDHDGDGLTAPQEYRAGTDPFSSDTDQDSMPDGYEIENGLDPLFDDAALDLDGDGLTNLQEYLQGLDPQVADWINPLVYVGVGGGAIGVVVVIVLVWKRQGKG